MFRVFWHFAAPYSCFFFEIIAFSNVAIAWPQAIAAATSPGLPHGPPHSEKSGFAPAAIFFNIVRHFFVLFSNSFAFTFVWLAARL
jgi:hypothetical protein